MWAKKLRVRSEVAELGYISPWKPQQETSRNNDLEAFLSKNSSPRVEGEAKFRWARTEPLTGHLPKGIQTTYSKKTTRTEPHHSTTITDFRQALQRTFNRKFYSRSASAHTAQFYHTEQALSFEAEPIFAKRCRESTKPKLVTLGNCGAKGQGFGGKQQQGSHKRSSETRAIRRKKEFMLKKQSMTQEMLKGQIVNHKGFIASLQGCLADMQHRGESVHDNTVLASTVKKFLTHHYKRL